MTDRWSGQRNTKQAFPCPLPPKTLRILHSIDLVLLHSPNLWGYTMARSWLHAPNWISALTHQCSGPGTPPNWPKKFDQIHESIALLTGQIKKSRKDIGKFEVNMADLPAQYVPILQPTPHPAVLNTQKSIIWWYGRSKSAQRFW